MDTYLTIRDENTWNYFVTRAIDYDAYHLWQYHSVDPAGEPVLFVFIKQDLFIALPLLKRSIPNSSWFDFTSVYGYSGPVANQKFKDISDEDQEEFRLNFLQFMKNEQCISAFSRLHPFLDHKHFLEKLGGINENGKTLYIDLTVPYEEQVGQYDRKLAKQIRNLKSKNYEIVESSDNQAIECFTEIYTENMRRVAASNTYFFKQAYFTEFLEANRETCKLMMVYDRGKPAAGALILHCKHIIRQHLSATSADYIKESPSKFITDEVSLLGRRLGAEYYHMGGGVGGQEDSLFKYKASFSKLSLDDYTWRFIANKQIYNSLVEKRGLAELQSNFFPLYRSHLVKSTA